MNIFDSGMEVIRYKNRNFVYQGLTAVEIRGNVDQQLCSSMANGDYTTFWDDVLVPRFAVGLPDGAIIHHAYVQVLTDYDYVEDICHPSKFRIGGLLVVRREHALDIVFRAVQLSEQGIELGSRILTPSDLGISVKSR